MGKVVFLGHGGFDPTSGTDIAVVMVPPGTSLKFFSDAGQALVLPTKGDDTDYTKVVAVWEHFKESEPPISERGVTYNFSLAPEDSQAERDLASSLDWGGATVVTLPDGAAEFYMCAGTLATCPTPKLNVAVAVNKELAAKGEPAVAAYKKWLEAGGTAELPEEIKDLKSRIEDVPVEYRQYIADGVPEDRWFHKCNGILGKHAGNELFWVACTSIEVETPDLRVLDTADASGPGAVDISSWTPADADLTSIADLNKKNVLATANKGIVNIVAGGDVVLIGADHERRPADYVRRQGDIEEGQITVTKGGAFGKGSLAVAGITSKQSLVRSEIARFTDMAVTFP